MTVSGSAALSSPPHLFESEHFSTDKIHAVNGQSGDVKADAPAAGQAEAGEADDDSDDDADDGTPAAEGAANGGMFVGRFPVGPSPTKC